MNKQRTLAEKILAAHLLSGSLMPGVRGAFSIDSVLFHDMSGILAMMAYDAMGQRRAGVTMPLLFTDHNLVGMDTQTANDQRFVKSCAKAFGLTYSKPGSGICHALFSQRFAKPGLLLIGADSHTASCGALGMLGIGMGGMETAAAMTGKPFSLRIPRVINVQVAGNLADGVSAMDAALLLLSRMSVKGAVNAVLEYTGEGVRHLTVSQRRTLCNLGAEMGSTASVFPADKQVFAYLSAQGRERDFVPLKADTGAAYDETVELDLSQVRPMVALPGRPDRGIPVAQAEKIPFSQIFIGSCANGDYGSIARAALIVNGRKIHRDTALLIGCDSRQSYQALLRDGYLDMLLSAGARLLECGCGPCMGIGQAPENGAKVLRTTNRNFSGRSGTKDAEIFLASPETAAASALTGRLTAAEEIMDVSELNVVREPECYPIDDSSFLPYDQEWTGEDQPAFNDNIRPIPRGKPFADRCEMAVSLVAGDGVSTDDIVPAIPEALTLRANIPALSQYLFGNLDPSFAKRAGEMGSSMIVAGEDYAQGSSREHAAAGCLALGVRAVLVKSIHRIHRSNLINYGVLPLLFDDPRDYEKIALDDRMVLSNIMDGARGRGKFLLVNKTKGITIPCHADLNDREADMLLAGGMLSAMREGSGEA